MHWLTDWLAWQRVGNLFWKICVWNEWGGDGFPTWTLDSLAPHIVPAPWLLCINVSSEFLLNMCFCFYSTSPSQLQEVTLDPNASANATIPCKYIIFTFISLSFFLLRVGSSKRCNELFWVHKRLWISWPVERLRASEGGLAPWI
jgi:hypothetical protein